jgi:hypothetical protein
MVIARDASNFDEELGYELTLLHEHHNLGSDHGTTIATDSDHLLDLVLTGFDIFVLSLEKGVHVEQISCGLDLVVSELTHGLVCLEVTALAHVPARRFRTEEDKAADNNSWKHSRSHHQTPVETGDSWLVWDVVKSEIGSVSDHDSKSRPHLPLHHESTSDLGWCALCGIDGNSSRFGTDSETKKEPGNEHMPPSVYKSVSSNR